MSFKKISLPLFSILFLFIYGCQSQRKSDLDLINKIISQLEMQTPYVSETYFIPDEKTVNKLKNHFSAEELKTLVSENKGHSLIQNGDIEYYDRFLHKTKEAEILTAKDSTCDRNIISFARPLATDRKLILVWKDEFRKCKDNELSPLKSYSAVIFEANSNGQWELKDNLSLNEY